ncbi:hypothetical protein ACFQ0K_18835 [Nocardioides caeni]|uniref:Choice-of-anchor G family protein n=1 Tax=Nocardioides caeni TaxID=574700 RepID=A0A4S8NAP0_9ACTN|nr:hypothetical protein [Nocardioides caeni]THV13195.1 hypothetical protein E9934_09455 [Nocardioides caeni]
MALVPRVLVSLTAVAVTAGLVLVPSTTTAAPAIAAAAPSAGSAPSAECTRAQSSLARARRNKVAADRAVLRAKRELRRAQRNDRPAKVTRARKRNLAAANRRRAVAARRVVHWQGVKRSACAQPASEPEVQIGQQLDLLSLLLGGGAVGTISASQLAVLLDKVLPGISGHLDPTQLAGVLTGFNAGSGLSLGQLTSLLGGGFDPGDVADLLTGSADPAAVQEFLTNIVGQLSALGGGTLPPAPLDPAQLLALTDLLAGITGNLGPIQLGGLLALLAAGTGESGALDLDELTTLLDGLLPGLADQFDPSELTALLSAFDAGAPGAAELADLLGGLFSPEQLLSVLAGTPTDALFGEVIAQVLGQFAAVAGGSLPVIGTLDPSVLTDLLDTVTGLLGGLLGGSGGGGGEGGNPLCQILPILC